MPIRRGVYVALLASTVWLPRVSSSPNIFPEIDHRWALLPFAALMLLPLIGRERSHWSALVDVGVLLCVLAPLCLQHQGRLWPYLLIYPVLGCLALRMLASRDPTSAGAEKGIEAGLPVPWLVAGIAVLVGVHLSWGLGSHVITDVGQGSVQGAVRLLHGHAVYGPQHGPFGTDPHTDTYGPANYEAYLPWSAVFGQRLAAHVATVVFDLLTAVLLFVLGRRDRSSAAGVMLAYTWLAFPATLYEDALGFNDALVAASVVAVILAAKSPRGSGALAAVAAWTKLSPLALIPLLLGQAAREGRSGRGAIRFAGTFVAVSALIFLPVLSHSSPTTFLTRTFGYQSSRPPSGSLWDVLQFAYARHTPWLGSATKIAHGLLAGAVGALILTLARPPRDDSAVTLAAKSAAVLIAVQACTDYYAFSYVLWFAPLVLIVALARRTSSDRSEALLGTGARPRRARPGSASAPAAA